MIYTVFFDEESDEMPQDFSTEEEAEEYAKERLSWVFANSYTISSVEGDEYDKS